MWALRYLQLRDWKRPSCFVTAHNPGLLCQAFTSNYWINSSARRTGRQRQMNYTTWIRELQGGRHGASSSASTSGVRVSRRRLPARDDTTTQCQPMAHNHKVACLGVLSSSSSARCVRAHSTRFQTICGLGRLMNDAQAAAAAAAGRAGVNFSVRDFNTSIVGL